LAQSEKNSVNPADTETIPFKRQVLLFILL